MRTATMHHHRVHTNQFEQNHIARKTMFQVFVCHRIATVFNDDSLAVELTNIWQSFCQDLRLDFWFDAR